MSGIYQTHAKAVAAKRRRRRRRRRRANPLCVTMLPRPMLISRARLHQLVAASVVKEQREGEREQTSASKGAPAKLGAAIWRRARIICSRPPPPPRAPRRPAYAAAAAAETLGLSRPLSAPVCSHRLRQRRRRRLCRLKTKRRRRRRKPSDFFTAAPGRAPTVICLMVSWRVSALGQLGAQSQLGAASFASCISA